MAEIVQLVGKSALGEPDKVTLEVANIIKNDYLQQNGISEYDQYCPFYKTSGMLRNMVDFHDKAQAAIANNPDMTWSKIKEHCSEIIYGLTQQKVRFSQRERESFPRVLRLPFESQKTFTPTCFSSSIPSSVRISKGRRRCYH